LSHILGRQETKEKYRERKKKAEGAQTIQPSNYNGLKKGAREKRKKGT